jgi:hypothetical protein
VRVAADTPTCLAFARAKQVNPHSAMLAWKQRGFAESSPQRFLKIEMTNPSTPSSDDLGTVIACGVLSATLAAICHETLGHALACYMSGSQVTLLTSIWIRCREASNLTVAAGPIVSLVAGLIGLVLLRRRGIDGAWRLALTLFCAFNLFWFAGQLIFHALTNADDWAIIAGRFQWPWFWRPISVVIGGVCYVAATWSIAKALRDRGPLTSSSILIGYGSGAASAFLAGLMWAAMPIRSAMEGFLALGVAPVGLFVIAWSEKRYRTSAEMPILRSRPMIAMSLTLFVIFILVQGRGLGSLASTGLPD